MKKKLLILILIIFPLIVHADEKAIFSVSDVSSSPGSKITIKFNIDSNPKFGVLTARVKYDNTKLEYVSGKLKAFKDADIKGIDNNKNKGIIAIYAISINHLLNDTGNIASIEFKINDKIKDNEDIPLTLEIVDFGVDDENALDYDVKTGVVHVSVNTEKKESDTKKDSVVDKLKEKVDEKTNDGESATNKSNDDNDVKVDDGAVKLNEDNDGTIKEEDKSSNVLDSKDYVEGKSKSKNKSKDSFKYIIVLGIVTIIIVLILIGRKNGKKRR